MLVPVITTAETLAVVAASAAFAATLDSTTLYQYVCSVGSYIKQGAPTPTASAASLSLYVPANVPVVLSGAFGPKLAAIRTTADGTATLVKLAAY